MPLLEASISTTKGFVKYGRAKTGAELSAIFKASL
jgi:hypothetical protein